MRKPRNPLREPIRAIKSLGADPLFTRKASGCRVYDADGNEFIDYAGSWRPMILPGGSSRKSGGSSFGTPTELEITLARMVVEAAPSVEMVRMVISGTEATMSAIRLARGFPGRNEIVKFSGCYHSHVDSLLVEVGSGAATFGVPDSQGFRGVSPGRPCPRNTTALNL
jgi:glutamate-1-semialdehyde 2,1-aminomutase